MGAPRRKNIIPSRRRVEDEDEEEEGSLAVGAEDDSLSEGSAISDADDDADAEGSEASDTDSVDRRHIKSKTVANGQSEGPRTSSGQPLVSSKKKIRSSNMHDPEVNMNGLIISADMDERIEGETKNPEEILEKSPAQDAKDAATSESPAEKRRREHEEYKKKRDADPAFVPNRGGFFMHDHRSAAPGQNGFRPFGKNKGKGRGLGGSSPAAG